MHLSSHDFAVVIAGKHLILDHIESPMDVEHKPYNRLAAMDAGHGPSAFRKLQIRTLGVSEMP